MPLDFATRPLTRTEISKVLHGITDTPPSVPPSVTAAAFWSTVAGLAGWCETTDIDHALDHTPLVGVMMLRA